MRPEEYYYLSYLSAFADFAFVITFAFIKKCAIGFVNFQNFSVSVYLKDIAFTNTCSETPTFLHNNLSSIFTNKLAKFGWNFFQIIIKINAKRHWENFAFVIVFIGFKSACVYSWMRTQPQNKTYILAKQAWRVPPKSSSRKLK